MSRRCMITGKAVMTGNNVSHAHNKTRRVFLPNVQDTSVFSEALGRKIKIRVSTAGLRTLEHKGGLDQFLMGTAPTKLDPALRPVRKQVEKVLADKK
ncbi:MAG TPA: 50S ribosomal protein L28 [Micavibrio sp.]|nr:50S ribosomal protein L28 [Pseudomonadota bacterium]HIF26588.1 50S ribosomal protein L28 [Micavibrio sp.]HIL28031.1 50S ribosomal protein L28 [Micavibrio sp.]